MRKSDSPRDWTGWPSILLALSGVTLLFVVIPVVLLIVRFWPW